MDFKILENSLVPILTIFSMRLLGVIAVLVLAWILAGWMRALLRKAFERAALDPTLANFFANAIRWTIILLGVLACLSLFGVGTTSFAAVIASAGLAIGLAFQGSLSNIAAGIMLLIFRPFKIGQVINVAGKTGQIRAINLFTTEMDTLDNRRIILPNGSVFGTVIENNSFNPKRRVDVDLGVDYNADIDRTREVLEEAIAAIEGGIEAESNQVVLTNLGASSVDWQVRVWCATADYAVVRQRLIRAVKMALDSAGISIPYPQLDVHLDRAGERN